MGAEAYTLLHTWGGGVGEKYLKADDKAGRKLTCPADRKERVKCWVFSHLQDF